MFRFNDSRNFKTIFNDEVLFHLGLNTKTRQCDMVWSEEESDKGMKKSMALFEAAELRLKLMTDEEIHEALADTIDECFRNPLVPRLLWRAWRKLYRE